MSMTAKLGALALLVCILLWGTSAPATVIIYTYDSTVDDPQGPFRFGDSGSFSLPQYYDPVWDLETVTVTITGVAVSGYNVFDNESDVAGWAEVSLGVDITVTSDTPSAPVVTLVIPRETKHQDVAADEAGEAGTEVLFLGHTLNADFAGPDSVRVETDGAADAETVMLAKAAGDDLSDWVGTGQITWHFASSLHATHSSNVPLGQVESEPPQFNFTAVVRYENLEPEPSSLLLLGGALAPVLIRRRRRRGARAVTAG